MYITDTLENNGFDHLLCWCAYIEIEYKSEVGCIN